MKNTLYLFISCNRFPETEVVHVNEIKNLLGTEILKNKISGNSIFIVDTLILMNLPKTHDSIYRVYGVKSNQYLGSLVKKGQGMQEFSAIMFSGQYEKSNNGIKIWLTDFNTMEMVLINVTNSLKANETIVEKRVSIVNKSIMEMMFLFYINNEKVIGYHNVVEKGQAWDKRLFIFNPFNSKVEFKSVPPIHMAKDMNSTFRNVAYSGMATIKPNRERIVDMRSYQPIVNIFDSQGNHINSLILKEDFESYFDTEMLAKRKFTNYNSWLNVSDNYIYVSIKDELVSAKKKKKNTIIRVFDWDGNSVSNLNIPANIRSFAVDEKNRNIYGLDVHNQKLLKYHY